MNSFAQSFERRGIVEGFFGPPWSMTDRQLLFKFGAHRGMNTYLYAPKDDPYHRRRWRDPYPQPEWRKLLRLIAVARSNKIDFAYGFHPGQGLGFSERKPVEILVDKAKRFYDVGVRTFAVLFDDIPSRLVRARDRRAFGNSLARAEGFWLAEINARQPDSWKDVEWWICPSYYSEDSLLERVFGRFEANFLERLAESLPANVDCFWTGPAVVSAKITLAHARRVARRLRHRLLLWDNYPVNDLSMASELHIGPLTGRDRRLPEIVHGYLNNPMLQPALSLVPLATCFDYAAKPCSYDPEASWRTVIKQRFGTEALAYWQTIRWFLETSQQLIKAKHSLRIGARENARLRSTLAYLRVVNKEKWARELRPWRLQMEAALQNGALGLS
ncbi:MAG: beta-N-acetylglucosaminidase domain-containing protein [Candidatus Binatia bacterium]